MQSAFYLTGHLLRDPLPSRPSANSARWISQTARHRTPRPVTRCSSSARPEEPAKNPNATASATPNGDTDASGKTNDDEPEVALILVACAVGVATGAGVVLFNDSIHTIRDAIWHGETVLSGRQLLVQFSELELWPRIVFPPVLGGVVVGALGMAIGGYADGTPGEERSSSTWYHTAIRPIARAVAAAVTLGTGASLGPEGPSVDIGKSCAGCLGGFLRSHARHVTSLLAAGSGAGVAAGFNAPISGVFFAVETVLQREVLRAATQKPSSQEDAQKKANQDSSGLTIAMVLLASVLAAVVSQAGLGSSPAFRVPEYRLESFAELPLYLLFGALCGAVSTSFSYSARVAEEAFAELRQGSSSSTQLNIWAALLPALGGLTTGVLGLGYPEILYQGFDNINSVLASNGEYAPGLLIQIVVLKIIATTISRGSGLQGGLYAPSIFIGAALGSAFGLAVHTVGDSAGLVLSAPQAYALVGVAAMLASNCAVPLTSVLLLFELTRDYLIIVPTLGAVGISFWISSMAAPGVKNAATARRRAAAMAAASAATTPSDSAILDSLKARLLDGSLLQEDKQGPDASARAPQLTTPTEEAIALACAADRGCLLLQNDMTLAEALTLMEVEGQEVAVVVGKGTGILGMLSREAATLSGSYRDVKNGDVPVAITQSLETAKDDTP